MLFLFCTLFSLIGVLLAVAFFTLMERKIMSYAQARKGPNKVVLWGVTQPITDAMKLLSKETMKITNMKYMLYSLGPMVGVTIMTLSWVWYEPLFSSLLINLKIFPIAAIMGLAAFVFILTSWGSTSKYAILGGYRAIAQVVSYEVCLVLLILSVFYLCTTYSTICLKEAQSGLWLGVLCPPLLLLWLTMCMAESNRTPFDTSEGESEIVSGFNIEYGGGLFAVIFVSEYGMILFLSFISCLLFLGSSAILIKTILMGFIFIWVRCSFPRVRYDMLMETAWKVALPYSIFLLSLNMTASM